MPTVLRIVNLITPTSHVSTYLTRCILLDMLVHFLKRILCSTCCMILCTFHTRPDYVTTHTMRTKHTETHILYTYSAIHTTRYDCTRYAVDAFLYVLRITNCSKHTRLYMLYSTCQATRTTLHITSYLYLPYVVYYTYYASLH